MANPVYAYGRYLAILCVGTEKRLHSEYLDGLYDENSVYAFYDYCDIQKPTLEVLNQCGFLPSITHSYDWEKRKHQNIGWTYKFTTFSSFRCKDSYGIKSLEKIHCLEEAKRFNTLLERKAYSDETERCVDLYNCFWTFFPEKIRLSELNIKIDTLLDVNAFNPPLRKEIKR